MAASSDIVFGKALVYFMVYAVMGMYLALVVPKMFGFVSMVTWTTILGVPPAVYSVVRILRIDAIMPGKIP